MVSFVVSVYKKNFTGLSNVTTRTTMNAKILVFVICFELIMYLLYYLHDCTFCKKNPNFETNNGEHKLSGISQKGIFNP